MKMTIAELNRRLLEEHIVPLATDDWLKLADAYEQLDAMRRVWPATC